ncbi:MAG: hypothetical protein E7160_01040 [Firmicutes bacterium]|nr:hypothetical protein [Bacillota bacterium]
MTTRTELNKEKQKEIINEEMHIKRKRFILSFLKFIVFVIVFTTLFFFYVTYVSNAKIIVKENRVISKKLPDNFNGLKIIQFSDIHFGTTIFNDELNNLVKLINSRKPDLVVFTGDLIDKEYKLNSKEQEKIITSLKNIDASIGKYAIYGDEDKEEFNTIFNQSDFTILNNDYDLLYKNNTNPILLVGVNSSLNKKIDIDKAYKYFKDETSNSNIYTISILHEPDSVIDILNSYKSDLFLAGHSHNGQVRIPYIGSFSRKDGARKYYNEHYMLDNSQLFISSGIGTNGGGVRLFTRPSINYLRLSNK